MCVSCGGAWVDEGDVGEMKMVEKRSADDMSAAITESPRSRARRELYATGNSIVEERARAAQMPKQDEAREMDLYLDEEDGEEVQAPAPMPSTSVCNVQSTAINKLTPSSRAYQDPYRMRAVL
jgi:Zn-finger nucleic acid-binding protein